MKMGNLYFILKGDNSISAHAIFKAISALHLQHDINQSASEPYHKNIDIYVTAMLHYHITCQICKCFGHLNIVSVLNIKDTNCYSTQNL